MVQKPGDFWREMNADKRKRIIFLLVLVCLSTGVFFNQLRQVAQEDLSRWKGGGMGMFSAIDSPGMRFVKVAVMAGGQDYPVNRQRIKNGVKELEARPTKPRALELCQQLQAKGWNITTKYVVTHAGPSNETSPALRPLVIPTSPSTPASLDISKLKTTTPLTDIAGFRIEVWKAAYNYEAGEIYSTKLFQVTYHADEDRCSLDN